jgi:hypothetical protein
MGSRENRRRMPGKDSPVRWSFILGILVALGIFGYEYPKTALFPWPRLELLIWPTVLVNVLAMNREESFFANLILIVSIALNGIYYAFIVTVARLLYGRTSSV